MGCWKRWSLLGLSITLAASLVTPGWTAEPYPPPPPEPPAAAPEMAVVRDAPVLTDEEREVVENMELLEAMELLENLEVLRSWEVVTGPAREIEPQGPPPKESSYGDFERR